MVSKSFGLLGVLGLMLFTTATFALECGDSIAEDTVLDSDLHCDGANSFFALQVASNVTLDLNGHTISGSDDILGLELNTSTNNENITIRNGVMSGFFLSIQAGRNNNLTIENMVFLTSSAAIQGVALNNATIHNNIFTTPAPSTEANPASAIAISTSESGQNASNNSVRRNQIFGFFDPILVCGATANDNTIANNVIANSEGIALRVVRSTNGTRIIDNQFIDNRQSMQLNSVANARIRQNHVYGGEFGIVIRAGNIDESCIAGGDAQVSNNDVRRNTFVRQSTVALLLGALPDSQIITQNAIRLNKFYANGVALEIGTNAVNNRIRRNEFSGNATDIIDDGAGNQF